VIEAAAVAARKRGRSVKVVFASTSGSVAGTAKHLNRCSDPPLFHLGVKGGTANHHCRSCINQCDFVVGLSACATPTPIPLSEQNARGERGR